MYDISNEFDSYKVSLCSRASAWRTSYHYSATISLHKGDQHVGNIRFRTESSTLKDNFFPGRRVGPDIVNLEYFDQDFEKVLSMLQQESPLFVCLRKTYNGNEGIGAITTTNEPVGEEEGE
jgi:hypothetical protein